MVWGAKGPLRDRAGRGVEHACDRVHRRHLERLSIGKRGEDGGESAREHGLARPGRTNQQAAMSASGSDGQHALGSRLTSDVGEIIRVNGRCPPGASDGGGQQTRAQRRDERTE